MLLIASTGSVARAPVASAARVAGPDPGFLLEFVTELNAFREQQGLPPLVASLALSELALQHSQDMIARGYFDHTGPDGVTFEQRVGAVFRREGRGQAVATENLASFEGTVTAADLLDALLANEQHRANLSATDTPFIGVGVVTVDSAPGVFANLGPVTVATSIQGPPQPTLAKTVLLVVVTPPVFERLPGAAAFKRVRGSQVVPVGTEVDTIRGRVRLTSVADDDGNVQTADFYTGRFIVEYLQDTLVAGQPPQWVTDLRLSGPLPICTNKRILLARPKAAAQSRPRQLWGSGEGTFRSEGHYAAATVRGTTWLVRDTCSGTLVKDVTGLIDVFDTVRNQHVLLSPGRSYLAQRPR